MDRREREALWLVPEEAAVLPAPREGRPRLALATGLALAAAAVPAYLLLAPPSVWEPSGLLAALLIMSFVSEYATVETRRGIHLDSSSVSALVALAFLGPLPAALVLCVPDVARGILGQRRRVPTLITAVSCVWAALAGALALEALAGGTLTSSADGADLLALLAAGLVMVCVNDFIASLPGYALHDGAPLSAVARESSRLAPVYVGQMCAGVGVAYLYERFGIPGLAPLPLITMLQPFPVVALMKAKPLTEIDEARLTVQFTRDIADILRLTRDQKRVLRDAALQRAGEVPSLSRLDDFDAVMRTVLYATERWDGRSRFPGVLGGEDIPIESRVLAVASAWAALTAGETHRLPPQAAIASIGARAGTEFDPRIVAAAAAVADYRIVFRPPSEQAAEPRLALP